MGMSTSARLILGLAMSLIAPATTPGAAAPTVVVAELFTSEGCSSCPPADTLMRQLAEAQPFDGAELIAVEEHVDYWDRLGWRDPFSSAQFTSRQAAYNERVFRSDAIYTPQLVVDGVRECVGSDRSAVRAIVAESMRMPRAAVHVQPVAIAAHLSMSVSIDLPAAVERRGLADVFVIIAERGLVSVVRRGENGGRTLAHGAVARSLATIGELSQSDRAFTGTVDVPIRPNWNIGNLQIVGVIQERDSRRILGAGAAQPSFRPGSDR
jgi:hypothetical protein